MRRIISLAALCLLAPLGLSRNAIADHVDRADRPDAVVRVDPPAAADHFTQVDQLDPVLEADLFGTGFVYRTLPGAQVLVDLTAADGTAKASSAAVAGDDGVARVAFDTFFLDGGNVAVVRFGGPPTVMEPGDTLRVLQIGAPARVIDIPDLTADVDADRIAGTGPAGAALRVDVTLGNEAPLGHDVVVGPDGRWALDLGPAVDLGTLGAAAAVARLDTPQNVRFQARAHTFATESTIGASQVRGLASPGTRIAIEVRTAEGMIRKFDPRTVTGDGRWTLPLGQTGGMGPGPVGPGPSGPGQGTPPHRIAPGDRLTFTQSGGSLGADRTWSVDVPDMAVDIDPMVDAVSGRGPAASRLRVVAGSLWGGAAEVEVEADASGTFRADLAGRADLAPGWRVAAWWAAAARQHVGIAAVIPAVEVGVDVARLSGLAEPGRRITVTLSTAAGVVRSRQVTSAGADGGFAVQHRPAAAGGGIVFGGDSLPARPGDRIEVEATAGDPLVFTVPELSATIDVAADMLSGIAPAGSKLRITAGAPGSGIVAVDASADAAGRFTVDLAGRHDIRPGSAGTATVRDPRGHTFFSPWSAPRLSIQVGADTMGGTAAPGSTIEAALVAPDGTVVAETTTTAPDFAGLGIDVDPSAFGSLVGSFFLRFTDIAGDGVPVREGDTVRVRSGGETVTVAVPALDGTVVIDADLVTGRTDPGRAVTIQAVPFGGGRATATVTADASGNFSHAFAGRPDLRYNDAVGLVLDVAGHSVGRTITLPGLTLDLDAGRVEGSTATAADARFRVEVRRGAAVVATAAGISGPTGEFAVQLAGADGRPAALLSGDVLTFRLDDRRAFPPLVMTVPELDIRADAATDAVTGRATPGGRLVVLARGAGSDFALSQSWPDIAADGRWAADFVPRWDVGPGTAIAARYHLPDGHVALRAHYVPQLRAEVGGPNVCGYARPGGAVTAKLGDAGTGAIVANADAVAQADGRFQGVLADPRGVLATTAGGQTVHADIAGTAADLALPALAATMDWGSGTLSGTGPADTMFEIGYPARRCVENISFGNRFGIGLLARTGADGAIRARFPLPVAPGEGIELTITDPSGHQAWRQLYRTLGRAFVTTDRVTGKADSGAGLDFTLTAAGGAAKGAGAARADADGAFGAQLKTPSGDPALLAPGDVLEITRGGALAARIVVEPLDFDWSRGDPVVGTAPAGREVRLELRLDDGRVLAIPRTAGADGVWRFTAAEVPPRATWALGDVAAVRATVATPDGHEVIFETPGFADGGVGPRPPAGGIFLPWLGRSASPWTAGALAAGAAVTHPTTVQTVAAGTATTGIGRPMAIENTTDRFTTAPATTMSNLVLGLVDELPSYSLGARIQVRVRP